MNEGSTDRMKERETKKTSLLLKGNAFGLKGYATLKHTHIHNYYITRFGNLIYSAHRRYRSDSHTDKLFLPVLKVSPAQSRGLHGILVR